MDYISDILEEPNKLSNKFEINETSSSFGSSNIITMKCTKALFSRDGLINNVSSYILFIFIFIFLLSILLYMKCGYHLLEEDIRKIIDSKKNTKQRKNININNEMINFPPKKRKSKNFNLINNINNIQLNKGNSNLNMTDKKISLNFNKKSKKKKRKKIKKKSQSNNVKTTNIVSKNKDEEKMKLPFNDFELNTFKLLDAIAYDKRTCFQYYISLLKTKQPIIFAFCPIKDYNLILIKLCIFCLSFSLYYSVNYFFFDDKMIHKIYEDEGKYDIIYFLPKISIAFAASHILSILIKLIFLSERNILQVRLQPTYSKANAIVPTVKRNLTIKYIVFFILGIIILIFFWMLLSSFGAVYQNTQIIVLENTLISFGISFIYPFFINIFPCIIRICSINSKSECLYTFSKILQIL